MTRWRQELIGDATLICGDCREVLPTLPRVEAVVTDPPYGLGESNRKKHMGRGQLAAPRDYGDYDWDEEAAADDLIDACRAISEHQIIWGGNYFQLPPTSCWLVWDKLNGENDFADCELAWTSLDGAVRRIRYLWNGMLRAEPAPRDHPTQKPVGVMTWAIGKLPMSAHTILDPFAGSGTTGVAALRLGRRFIGIEREERYFDVMCARIEAEHRQPRLFEEPRPKPVQERLDL